MTPSSAKQKGRLLQQLVRDRIIKSFPELTQNDVRSTSSGATGRDIQMSERALSLLPVSIECKSRKQISVYKDFEQALKNTGKSENTVLVIRQNRSDPLAIITLDYFLELLQGAKK